MMGLSHSSTDLATLADTAPLPSFEAPERSTGEADAERKELTQPERDPNRATGKPAEGNETQENPKHSGSNERLRTCLETYLADTMHPYHQEYAKEPSTQVGVHQLGHVRRKSGSSAPTLSNEAHILRRESEIYFKSDNTVELLRLPEYTSKPRAAKKTSKRNPSCTGRRAWGPGADPGGRGGPVPPSS